jgi:uncharacterized protein YmfQ (DUF2313 family)
MGSVAISGGCLGASAGGGRLSTVVHVPIAGGALSVSSVGARAPRLQSLSAGMAGGQLTTPPQPYTQTLIDLLPPGIAWSRDQDTNLWALCDALSREFGRVDQAASQLIDEMLPSTALLLLPEWEAAAGLPVPSATDPAQRRRNVCQWLTMPGRVDIPFWTALAALLGYAITITEYSQQTCDSDCTQALSQTPWQYVWDVNGESLGTGQDATLMALFRRLAQSHTLVRFNLT